MEQLLQQLLEHMDKRFDEVNNQFNGVNQRLDKLENSIQSLEETAKNNASEFRSHFKHVEDKLEKHDKMFEFITEAIEFQIPDKKLPFRNE